MLLALPVLTPAQAAEKINFALDWTPNTNHVGLYVAQSKGWFKQAGLDVDILPYADTSAGTLISSGVAQFGIVSSVGFNTQRAMGADTKLVFAVVQHETGRVVFKDDRKGIQSPKDLDGKTYGGFGSAWESALVSSMIQYDGGKGVFNTVTLGTSAYEALANGSVDFTLDISTWEGVNAKLLGQAQRVFRFADYGVPDQQTTLIAGNGSWLAAHPKAAKAFVEAVQRGYAFAADNPDAAADILIAQSNGMLTNPKLVHASMHALVDGGYLRDPGEPVGLVDGTLLEELNAFLFKAAILRDSNGDVLTTKPDVSGWYSNDYLAKYNQATLK